MTAALILAPGGEDPATLVARLTLAGVPILALGPAFAGCVGAIPADGLKARTLLLGLRELGADPASSWLACADPSVLAAAATAGLAGLVLIAVDPPPGDHPLVVVRADHLADVPRVMVPRGGGCWHDHRSAG